MDMYEPEEPDFVDPERPFEPESDSEDPDELAKLSNEPPEYEEGDESTTPLPVVVTVTPAGTGGTPGAAAPGKMTL